MKTTKLAKATDCTNNQSVIESELTVFPHEGVNMDVVVLSLDDKAGGNGVLLTPSDAEVFANGILSQVKAYEAHKVINIATDSDVLMSIQRATCTCNGHELPDEVCLLLKDVESGNEMVSLLTFKQTRALINELQRMIWR